MTDFDVTVTWRLADGSTLDLPATVCYSDDTDDVTRRAEVLTEAVTMNLVDFPDDLGNDPMLVAVRFTEAP